MGNPRWLAEDDPGYPRVLEEIPRKDRPRGISVEGPFERGRLQVAIVGSRDDVLPEVVEMVRRIAAVVRSLKGVIVSGGARGIDTAAHEAALHAGCPTWAVLACGAPHVTPADNAELFASIVQHGGTLIRPFRDKTPAHRSLPLRRNGVLVALSDVVVIAQAGLPSGTVNAGRWARDLKRPIWVTVGPPWLESRFAGCWFAIDRFDARPIRKEAELVRFLRAQASQPAPQTLAGAQLTLFRALGSDPVHPDELTARTGLSASAVATGLLTLSLLDVVVQGPPGLFRRKQSP